MNPKRRYLWAVSLVCLFLIVLHVFKEVINNWYGFTPQLDSTTLGLLALAALPVLWEIVDTVKAGGMELSFRQLAVHQQIFELLDSVATQNTWTFYPPRQGENDLGQGFGFLIKKLKDEHEKELIKHLKAWLEADNHNLKWFAAEKIGYYKITQLKQHLLRYLPTKKNVASEDWELNTLWAYSRFENYEKLKSLLLETKSEINQAWVIKAYSQMAQDKRPDERKERGLLASHMEE